jgi:hypothetical protein
MSSETVLYSTLAGDAPVSALVGTRIYPDVVPQDATGAAIAYLKVGTEPVTTIHSSIPLATFTTLEVWCMAGARAEAEAVAAAAVNALGAALFQLLDRRAEFDQDSELWASVLTVRHFVSGSI